MTPQTFSAALGEIQDRYITEAVAYRKKRRPHRAMWLAAVLAAATLLLMGSGGVSRIYDLLVGFGVVQTENRFSVDFSTGDIPAAVEDGRLFFVADGQHTDITDLTDEETPYIYTAVNPGTGLPTHVIVGGTPDSFGYAEIWVNRGKVGVAVRCGEISGMMVLTAQQFREGLWRNLGYPWLTAAMGQLELEQYLPDT